MVDKKDPYIILISGAILRSILSFLLLFDFGVGLFIILIFLRSMANLLFWASLSSIVAKKLEDEEKQGYFGTLGMMDQIGKILAPLYLGFLSGGAGYDTGLFSSSFAISVASLLFMSFFSKEFRVEREESFSVKIKSSPKDRFVISLFFNEAPVKIRAAFFLSVICTSMLSVYDPHLSDIFKIYGLGYTDFSRAVSFTAMGAAVSAFSFRCGFLKDNYFSYAVVGLSIFSVALLLVSSSLCSVGDGMAGDGGAFWVYWILCGYGYEMAALSCVLVIQRNCPSDIFGYFNMSVRSAQMLVLVVFPVVGGVVVNNFGHVALFFCFLFVVSFGGDILLSFFWQRSAPP